MAVDVFVGLEPRTEKRVGMREELMRILECLRGGKDFIIHSQWMQQAVFDAHAELPHRKRFWEWWGS